MNDRRSFLSSIQALACCFVPLIGEAPKILAGWKPRGRGPMLSYNGRGFARGELECVCQEIDIDGNIVTTVTIRSRFE